MRDRAVTAWLRRAKKAGAKGRYACAGAVCERCGREITLQRAGGSGLRRRIAGLCACPETTETGENVLRALGLERFAIRLASRPTAPEYVG